MTDVSDAARRPGRLDVGIVGAGRVGAVLGSALRAAGHRVVGASAISSESHDRIDALLPGVPVLEVPEIIERADLVLLTVPDDALTDLVAGLAGIGAWRTGQLVLHTSGLHGLDALAPAQRAGAITMAVHPAMTFTGTSVDLSRLVGCPFAVTAPALVLPIGQALVVEIGGEPVVVADEARGLYHAALAHGANHLVTLVAQARDLLATAGIEDESYLRPLLVAALDGALRGGDLTLTGPVMRGDVGTVSRHLTELASAEDAVPGAVASYRSLARATVDRLVDQGRLKAHVAAELYAVLDPVPDSVPPLDAPVGGSPPAPHIVRTRADLAATLRRRTGRRAVVMTMGALHEGHLDLVREARRRADHVVVTIFVNPLQFGQGEDFERYPRNLGADVAMLADLGVEVVFAPDRDEVYPDGDPAVRVEPGPLGEVLEGASRPGHFAGVLTVVHRLLRLTVPDVAVFGEKDFQQLALVRAMARDLDLGVEIVGVPIRREDDGLAMSSRNRYLGAGERERALVLSAALEAGAAAAEAGGDAREVLRAAREAISGGDVELDYLVLADAGTLEPLDPAAGGDAVLLVAAGVGGTRLIDNRRVTVAGR